MDPTTTNSPGSSTNNGVPGQVVVAELPPVLTSYLDAIKSTVHITILCAVWLGISIPILFALFYTSTKSLRRSAIFISNAFAISIGVLTGVLSVIFLTNTVLNPLKEINRPVVLIWAYTTASAAIIVDCILLFRVVVVYPKSMTTNRAWYGIMTPLVLFKIARFANFTFFTISFAMKTKTSIYGYQYALVARGLTVETIEWSLQLADNALCSFLFLWRLNKAQSFSAFSGTGNSVTSLRNSPYHNALASLFCIAATNFVFPWVFDIITFVFFYKDRDGSHYQIVLISNIYVQIIGVLFATIWRATYEDGVVDMAVEGPNRPRTPELTRLEFAQNQIHELRGSSMHQTSYCYEAGSESNTEPQNMDSNPRIDISPNVNGILVKRNNERLVQKN